MAKSHNIPPTTNGPVNAVTCPHCGKTNDLRALQEQQILDTASQIECDHCHRIYEVVRMAPVLVVTVRRPVRAAQTVLTSQGVRRVSPPRQATTLSPSQTRRLLKGK